jgi:hypothetical protein
VTVSVNVSLRYGVVGLYVDRAGGLVHVYPVFFVRISIARTKP